MVKRPKEALHVEELVTCEYYQKRNKRKSYMYCYSRLNKHALIKEITTLNTC